MERPDNRMISNAACSAANVTLGVLHTAGHGVPDQSRLSPGAKAAKVLWSGAALSRRTPLATSREVETGILSA
jgi:hypothetical protein